MGLGGVEKIMTVFLFLETLNLLNGPVLMWIIPTIIILNYQGLNLNSVCFKELSAFDLVVPYMISVHPLEDYTATKLLEINMKCFMCTMHEFIIPCYPQ